MKRQIRTMEELAEVIAVSRPTLSRFFHDPGTVRASTRARIEAGLARVDYVPNFFATHLNRAKTRMIGLVVPHLNDVFQMALASAIEAEAQARGHRLILQHSQNDGAAEAAALVTLRSMNVDGILVSPCGAGSDLQALLHQAALVPLVLVDSAIPGTEGVIPFVGNDNLQSVGLITDYLCRSGEPPAFLGMPQVNQNAQERLEAYLAAMAAAGQPPELVEPAPIAPSWDFEDYGYQTMARHFAQGRHMRGTLLCAADRIATGALKAAHDFQTGLRIAGHDNDRLTRYLHPGLTTVEQDIAAIARTALQVLLTGAQGSHRIPARIVIR